MQVNWEVVQIGWSNGYVLGFWLGVRIIWGRFLNIFIIFRFQVNEIRFFESMVWRGQVLKFLGDLNVQLGLRSFGLELNRRYIV